VGVQGLPKVLKCPLLSQERVGLKLRTSNLVRPFMRSITIKAINNFGKSSRGRSAGLPKDFKASI